MDEQTLQWIKHLIASNNVHGFYISTRWLKLRQQVLSEQHHECQLCKAKGLYTPANTVHHIKHLRQYPHLALTKSNLLCVCEQCHYEIHHGNEHSTKWDDEQW